MMPEFLPTALAVCLTPGVGVVCTLSVAVGRGARTMPWLRRAFGASAAGLGARLALERA